MNEDWEAVCDDLTIKSLAKASAYPSEEMLVSQCVPMHVRVNGKMYYSLAPTMPLWVAFYHDICDALRTAEKVEAQRPKIESPSDSPYEWSR